MTIAGDTARPRARARLAALLICAIAGGLAAAAGQDPAGQAPRRRTRGPVVLSDVLTHSTLASCAIDDVRASNARTTVRVATWNIRAARSAPVEAIAADLPLARAASAAQVWATASSDHHALLADLAW